MEQRLLGRTGTFVSELCLGTMTFARESDEATSAKLLDRYLEAGGNFIDTADVYADTRSEEVLGRLLRGRRDEVVLATKFGIVRSDDPTYRGIDGRPEYVRAACEGSLKRLGVETIDLYYQHRVDPKVAIEEVAATVKDLIKEGKVLHFGLSEASAKTIRRAHAVEPVTAVQTEYSLMERDPEKNGVLATCEELGIGFVPWGPVGMGYLTGKMDVRTKLDPKTDLRSGFDRFSPENLAANMPIVDFLRRFAQKTNATPAQISLAWLLAQKPFIVPIPGTRNIGHLSENLGAINVRLTPEDLREIDTAFSKIKVHGGRMNEEQMKVVDETE